MSVNSQPDGAEVTEDPAVPPGLIRRADPGPDVRLLPGRDEQLPGRPGGGEGHEDPAGARDAAWANRGFHQRAARWLAEQGIRQFIDIGSGLPTVGNTHEVVQRVVPDARVVYVDIDPMVGVYSRAADGQRRRHGHPADLRDPPACWATGTCAR